MSNHICASYHEHLLVKKRREQTINKCCKELLEIRRTTDFYALAISGTSGILGAIVADKLGLDLITVRGVSTTAHSHRSAEGLFIKGNYIIFDDLIDSGETVHRVWSAVNKQVTDNNTEARHHTDIYESCRVKCIHSWAPKHISVPILAGVFLYDDYKNMIDGRSLIRHDGDAAVAMPQFKVWGLE